VENARKKLSLGALGDFGAAAHQTFSRRGAFTLACDDERIHAVAALGDLYT
jgi:hypothetical protein